MESGKIKITFIIILLIVIVAFVFIKINSSDAETKIINTTTREAEVKRETILLTLSASGEVTSATTEKLSLNKNYSFSTMCVEKDEYIKQGSNILRYTNGTYLTAPYNCVVTQYSVPNVNGTCTDTNYIAISSVDDLYMDLEIKEDQLDKVKVGQEVDIVANYNEGIKYTGTISKINDIGTTTESGTAFAAIVSLKNDGTLKLGMSASCTVTLERYENILVLPIEAVKIEDGKKYVYVVNEKGNKERVEIKTNHADAINVEITEGISEGDKVSYDVTTVTNIKTSNSSGSGLTSLFTPQRNRN